MAAFFNRVFLLGVPFVGRHDALRVSILLVLLLLQFSQFGSVNERLGAGKLGFLDFSSVMYTY
jgi:hypothetical protein